jgi:hypothetical protein
MSLDDYVAPVFLTDTAKNLNDKFYLILNNLINTYPAGKLHGSDTSISDSTKTNLQVYQDHMSQMMQLQNQYFIYKNSIAKNSQDMLVFMNGVDDKINVLDAANKNLTGQLASMSSSTQSAEGMLDDSQITRNQMLYGNIFLFGIMVGGGYIYYKKVMK